MDQEATTAPPKRLAILTASIGSGHNAVVRAIVEELTSAAGTALHIDVIDTMDVCTRTFRTVYAGGFFLGMTRLPRVFGWGYRLTDRPQRPGRSISERLRLANERLNLRRLFEQLERLNSDLIVHTHFLAPPHVAVMRDRGRISCPQWVITTDYELHRYWYSQGVQRWFASCKPAAQKLRRWGIPDDQVVLSGIPVHRRWGQGLDQDAVRREWRLPAGPIIVLSGGTDYTVGPVVQTAQRICHACGQAVVAVLGGKNKQLLAGLASTPEAAGRKLIPISFTDRVHELVGIASLMVTKPGGITLTECLAAKVPMILTSLVPSHESGNAYFLQAKGAAVICEGGQAIAAEAARMLAEPGLLDKMRASQAELFMPGRGIICQAILKELGLRTDSLTAGAAAN